MKASRVTEPTAMSMEDLNVFINSALANGEPRKALHCIRVVVDRMEHDHYHFLSIMEVMRLEVDALRQSSKHAEAIAKARKLLLRVGKAYLAGEWPRLVKSLKQSQQNQGLSDRGSGHRCPGWVEDRNGHYRFYQYVSLYLQAIWGHEEREFGGPDDVAAMTYYKTGPVSGMPAESPDFDDEAQARAVSAWGKAFLHLNPDTVAEVVKRKSAERWCVPFHKAYSDLMTGELSLGAFQKRLTDRLTASPSFQRSASDYLDGRRELLAELRKDCADGTEIFVQEQVVKLTAALLKRAASARAASVATAAAATATDDTGKAATKGA